MSRHISGPCRYQPAFFRTRWMKRYGRTLIKVVINGLIILNDRNRSPSDLGLA
jgi:hypothetical protein